MLEKIEKAVRSQIPCKDYYSLNSVRDKGLDESAPLIIAVGMWDEMKGDDGTFCDYYPISKKSYRIHLSHYKKILSDVQRIYKRYKVIDDSVFSLIYNFRKITNFELDALIALAGYKWEFNAANERSLLKGKTYPKEAYGSLRMYLKLLLARNFLSLTYGSGEMKAGNTL